MNGTQIRTTFHGLIDNDELDEDLELGLANAAKDEIESELDLEITKKCDRTQTASTAAKSLPADFISPIHIIIGNDKTPLSQIPFEQQEMFSGNARMWYLDMANSQYYLSGNQSGQRINFYYHYQTAEITATVGPVWPTKFHRLIPYKMAKLFYGADQTERNFAWDPMWDVEYKLWIGLMSKWNTRLKKRAIENGLSLHDMYGGLATDENGMDISDAF